MSEAAKQCGALAPQRQALVTSGARSAQLLRRLLALQLLLGRSLRSIAAELVRQGARGKGTWGGLASRRLRARLLPSVWGL